MSTNYTVTVIEQPTIRAAGVKVRTSMTSAMQDCPKLWSEVFGPRMAAFPADPAYPGQSFGVSIMIDENTFDYWAVLPLAPDAAIPDGMEALEIPGGSYAVCSGIPLANLSEVYNHMYIKWPASQSEYVLDCSRPGIEAYRSNFCETQLLDVLNPVKHA